MARKLSEASSDTQAAAGVGHNSEVTEDDFLLALQKDIQHLATIEGLQTQLKAAKKARSSDRNAYKSKGGMAYELDFALQLSGMENQEEARRQLQRKIRAAQWAGVAVGEQVDIFKAMPAAAQQELDIEARGYNDIMAGKKDPATGQTYFAGKPPSDIKDPKLQQCWMKGAHNAQEKINQAFVKKNEAAADTPVEQAAKAPEAEAPAAEVAKTAADVMSDPAPVSPVERQEGIDPEVAPAAETTATPSDFMLGKQPAEGAA